MSSLSARIKSSLNVCSDSLRLADAVLVEGHLNRVSGLTWEATGCKTKLGSRCLVEVDNDSWAEAEVVGFNDSKLFLMPTTGVRGLMPNARVIPTGSLWQAPVGEDLLGRVVDGACRPLDGKGPISSMDRTDLYGREINPFERQPIEEALDVGVKSINALFTVGRGQRMGLFAGSGVGKSVLLGMMTRFTSADVVVVGLIGERGREVSDFVRNSLGKVGMEKSVVVASPADQPPLMRMHGALLATSIAEYFRDQGKNVLLLMDSLTRFCQAQREIALAIGEPPATRGYPASVFAKLPHLVERAGNAEKGRGSITAFYTVLTEGDDHNDPVADAARAILDGHIVLSRQIAEAGRYPAIDVEASISRVMNDIIDGEHKKASQRLRRLYSKYEQNKDLVSVGAYQKGGDLDLDAAISARESVVRFLSQDESDRVGFSESVTELKKLVSISTNTA